METKAVLPLEVTTAGKQLGENIRLARVRRRMSQDELAKASNITRKTLYALENGKSSTTMATVFSVLWKLGLLGTSSALANPDADEHGKILEAAHRSKRVRPLTENDNDF